jgi:hypothetical protein
MGWCYGVQLPLIVNDEGELLAFRPTPGNVDDRQPVERLATGLGGQLCGDRGYISQTLHDILLDQGLALLTKKAFTGPPARAFVADARGVVHPN